MGVKVAVTARPLGQSIPARDCPSSFASVRLSSWAERGVGQGRGELLHDIDRGRREIVMRRCKGECERVTGRKDAQGERLCARGDGAQGRQRGVRIVIAVFLKGAAAVIDAVAAARS